MDLQSFCVDNRRKVHPFSLLRQSVQSTQKMPQALPFGVPVNGDIMGEHCFQNIHQMSCKTEVTFQCLNKESECPPKKSCFDHFNKLSSFSFSKVVGGFVGSKSQGGSASREPHQVWDVILRQWALKDTDCQESLNHNLHQYLNLGNRVSHSIFGQLSGVGNSTAWNLASYVISGQSDFFSPQKMAGESHIHNADVSGCRSSDFNDFVNRKSQPFNECSAWNEGKKQSVKVDSLSSFKQSYADVAKSHITSRLESNSLSEMPAKSLNSSWEKRPIKRFTRKGHERERRNGNNLVNCSQNPSSQYQHHKKHPMPLDRYDEPIPSKFVRERFDFNRYNKPVNCNVFKNKPRDSSYHSSFQSKNSKVAEEKKPRYNKSRNYNMRERERKTLDLQVHEDIAYVCNMSEEECQNWRCEHNRVPGIPRGKAEFFTSRQNCFNKKLKNPVRLHSPPPRTFVINSQNSVQKMSVEAPIKKCEVIPLIIPDETSKSCQELDSCDVLQLKDIEPLTTCPSVLAVLPERTRLLSECSVDSEDSCIVFEKDDLDCPDDYSEETESDDTDSDSDCDSNSVSTVEDCDEVDFQYYSPSKMPSMSSDRVTDIFSPIPDRLDDVNKKWREENYGLSEKEKIPKKVRFANGEELTKVHPMIHWGFAYREARRGPWEEAGRDRCRFQMRISNAERELSCILDPEHRKRVWENRMCPVVLA